jgi:hypothetical protein
MRWRGCLSFVVLLLTWAALHDITVDNDDSFTFEYTLLVLSGGWFGSVAAYLLGRRHTVAGITSVVAVVIGVVAFWSLPHHHAAGSWVNELGWFPPVWFFALAVRAAVRPWSARTPAATSS